MKLAAAFTFGVLFALACIHLRAPAPAVVYADGYLLRVTDKSVNVLWTRPADRLLPHVEVAPGIDINKDLKREPSSQQQLSN